MRRLWLVAVVLVACGKGPSTNTADGSGSNTGSDSGGGGGDGSNDGWTTLISRTWNITAGTGNVYRCRRVQVPQDMWISGYRSLSPVGTHHEVLTIDPNDTYTGDNDTCNAGTGTLSGQMLYAAGLNTDDLLFPQGVAMHLAAGTWINLNLHLFDAQDNDLSGESGILVQTMAQSDVVNEADMSFSGTTQIMVPSDGQTHTESGGCNAPTDLHVFALWPHMHQIAVHQTLIVTHNSVPTTMLDTPFQFNEQKNYPMAEMTISQGDRIETTCSYVNNTGATVDFCDESQCEMCFTGIYKYPAGTTGGLLGCVDR